MTATELAAHAPDYVRRIAPYVPGTPIEELARELSLDPATIVKLASNENPRGPSPKVLAAIAAAAADATRYPDGNGFELKRVLSERWSVGMDQIVLGNGSNDLLELVALAFLTPGDSAVFAQHAFAVYPLATQARGATPIEVPARDYGHDLPAMLAAIRPTTRIVWIANPNNPTGTWLPADVLKAFVAKVPSDVIVVLDEAYDEYLDPSQRSGSVGWIAAHPNLVVSRTFSKAYGLAGLRVGYGVMDAALADLVNRVRQPFNVNLLAQAAAIAALDDVAYVDESRELNRQGLAQLTQGFERLGLSFLRPFGNFVLVRVGDAGRINAALLRQGVIVRPVGNYGLPEWLRVSVGLPQENARLLDALAQAMRSA